MAENCILTGARDDVVIALKLGNRCAVVLSDGIEATLKLVRLILGVEIEERSWLRHGMRPIPGEHVRSAELHDQDALAGTALAREERHVAQWEAIPHRPFAIGWLGFGPLREVAIRQRLVLSAACP